ncbi:MAG: DNA-directed RNA polymerase subunit alpha [Planctomycetota bacterium]|jgi:DNA-directed RNA polymerase subunit alpha
MTIATEATGQPEPQPQPQGTDFQLATAPIPSFGALLQERAKVFSEKSTLDAFETQVTALGEGGEEGRRRGLGLWMTGHNDKAVTALAPYPDDDVASFTRANALMALDREAEAQPIFEALTAKYPEEPRPRGAAMDAQFEATAKKDGEGAAGDALEAALGQAPESFNESAEGKYLTGRLAEARLDHQTAMDCYRAAREVDPSHRRNLFRLAFVAERYGHEDLALECYETMTRILPIDRVLMNNLGVLYEDMGRDQEAAVCYDMIAKSFPMDRRARLFLEDARAGMEMYYDEDLEKKEDRLNQILRIPITDFELSVRARNCLNKMDIMALGDLVKKTEAELLSYKNFGETSLAEIKEILSSKGLRLGMARDEAVASIAKARHLSDVGDPNDVRNRPISELKLSIRARRTVENLGCMSLGDVTAHSEEELLGMPNFGVTSLLELKSKLVDLNLKLKGEL